MVANITTTINEKNSLEIWPIINPWAAKIKENSPICASEVAVKKAGFFVYLNSEQIVMIKKGLNVTIKKIRTTIENQASLIASKEILIPKETKNNNEKKSLKDFTFPIISRL